MDKAIKYKGWTIARTWVGAYQMYVATHDKFHDESGDWQVYGDSLEEAMWWADEKTREN